MVTWVHKLAIPLVGALLILVLLVLALGLLRRWRAHRRLKGRATVSDGGASAGLVTGNHPVDPAVGQEDGQSSAPFPQGGRQLDASTPMPSQLAATPASSSTRLQAPPSEVLSHPVQGSATRHTLIGPGPHPIHDGKRDLDRLIALGSSLSTGTRDSCLIHWPATAHTDGSGDLIGCTIRVPDPTPVKGLPESPLDLLLVQHLSRDERGDAGRSLLVEVARFLDSLHSRGWAYGAIRWDSILYSLDPEPRVAIRNLEGARRIGGRPAFTWRGEAAWADPRDPSQVPTLDRDRFLFALMAYRLLVTQDPESPFESNSRYDVAGHWSVGELQALNLLLRRASQSPVGRPAMDLWVAVLDSSDHRATSHNQHPQRNSTLKSGVT